ncbi:MAG: glutathione S-transferase family protein [Sedimentitalea sp.]
MLFYDCSTAPSPRRARMFIAEKGLQIDTQEVSMRAGEQLKPDFLAVNPRATIPVLVTDAGTALTENIAIAAYLEAAHPEPPLMGRTPDEKALVLMWNAISEANCGAAIAEAFRNSHPAMKDRAIPGPNNYAQIPELAERGRAKLAVFFDTLEARLAESAYLATDHLTLADITTFVFVDFARVIQTTIPEDNSATKAWFDAIKTRPSAQL